MGLEDELLWQFSSLLHGGVKNSLSRTYPIIGLECFGAALGGKDAFVYYRDALQCCANAAAAAAAA